MGRVRKGRPVDEFTPYATMFKIANGDVNGCHKVVECVSCRGLFPLADLLSGELNEDHCPACNTHSSQFWKGRPHRPVPKGNEYGTT